MSAINPIPAQDLIIPQGTDYTLQFFITDDSDVGIDLTGSSFASQCRYSKIGDLAFSFTFQLGDQSANPGQVFMSVAKVATSAIGIEYANPLYYDVEWTDSNSKTKRIFEGRITLSPEVTR